MREGPADRPECPFYLVIVWDMCLLQHSLPAPHTVSPEEAAYHHLVSVLRESDNLLCQVDGIEYRGGNRNHDRDIPVILESDHDVKDPGVSFGTTITDDIQGFSRLHMRGEDPVGFLLSLLQEEDTG